MITRMCTAVFLRKYEKNKLKKQYITRENAIRVGCNSAMILICEESHLKAQYVEEFSFDFLKKDFGIKNKELLLIASSDKERIAKKGILILSCSLNLKLAKLFREIYQ